MFTRMSKGLLALLVIALLICSIVIGIGIGFMGFVCAVLCGGVLLLSFGIYIELANNILDIKLILAKTYNIKVDEEDMGNKEEEQKVRKIQYGGDEKWICNECGTQNKPDTTWCRFCGKQTG